MNYSDIERLTTSTKNFTTQNTYSVNNMSKNYFQDFKRDFGWAFLAGGKVTFGFNARISKNVSSISEVGYIFVFPIQKTIQVQSSTSVNKSSDAGIPWLGKSSQTLSIGYGNMITFNSGLRFTF